MGIVMWVGRRGGSKLLCGIAYPSQNEDSTWAEEEKVAAVSLAKRARADGRFLFVRWY